MLFSDGNRIDLKITADPSSCIFEPTKLLLDKTGKIEIKEVSSDFGYVKKPTQMDFSDCCNEFWWFLNNVGKGIARNEISYVMVIYNLYCRDMLILMT